MEIFKKFATRETKKAIGTSIVPIYNSTLIIKSLVFPVIRKCYQKN